MLLEVVHVTLFESTVHSLVQVIKWYTKIQFTLDHHYLHVHE